jgi:hypothetical protein
MADDLGIDTGPLFYRLLRAFDRTMIGEINKEEAAS